MKTIITNMLFYFTIYHSFLLQGKCFQNICKSFKLVGTYQSNPLKKPNEQSEKKNCTWEFDEITCKTRMGFNHLQLL
jgi:hypothetical protein